VLPLGVSLLDRSQHLVGHFMKASKTKGVIFMDPIHAFALFPKGVEQMFPRFTYRKQPPLSVLLLDKK
jgi:hypothetical protein